MQITLAGLGKTYDGTAWAVRDLDLQIDSGSIFGLIGPNGAGKSTALRMIATVIDPSAGEVIYDGVHSGEAQALRTTELRQRIGFLGDGNPLYKDMTPVDYLRFFGQCLGIEGPALEQAIERTLTTFDLTAKANTRAGALSKGMRQRLLIARCLLHDPSLLILDEPADGLDPRGRSDLRRILDDVRARGVTVLISSHILRELDDLCDQVAIVQRGRLVVSGPVNQIIERYEVGRFVYEVTMLDGLDLARQVLGRHRALIEHEGLSDGRPTLAFQVQGGDTTMASILSDLITAGVRVVTASRVRSRLEDVYDRISDDRVN